MIFQNSSWLLKAVELPLEKNGCCVYESDHQSGKERKKKTQQPGQANGDKDPR